MTLASVNGIDSCPPGWNKNALGFDMSLEWNDAFKIGNVEIDAQHQQLFSRVNDFLAAKTKAKLTACAMEMFRYTREHFAHEESLMKSLKYPALADHLAQHNDLLSLLSEVAGNIAKDTINCDDLEAFLSHWLLGHIATSDQSLAFYVKSGAKQ